jgi:glycosyltransferase involved in cell wall biosynthesis
MRFNFILPTRTKRPIGGFKIMYEYASRLAQRGHDVNILHRRKRFQRYSPFMYVVARKLKEIENAFFPFWFKFPKSCKISYIRFINDHEIPDADATIYTWWELGFEVSKLSNAKGIKVNLIQGYETWKGNVEKLHQSYNLPGIQNIVIATYLKDIVAQHTSKPAFLLYNAIDTSVFKIKTGIENRNVATVCMLYHKEAIKGSIYGIEALKLVKKEIPDLKAILFGVYKKPDNLPEFVEYHRKPKYLCDLYNRSAIYFTNSLQEGWALPPAEAMACGCALICTNIGGHLDYANKNTAVLVEPENPEETANAIIDLIKHPGKRIRLAEEGNHAIQQFSWNRSIRLLEEYVENTIGNQLITDFI